MKITLDHNCLIDLAQETKIGKHIRAIIDSPETECFIVNIGASEMRERGILPEHYDQFENFLSSIGIANLERLNPVLLYGVTFLNYCVYASAEDLALTKEIESVLFPNKLEGKISEEGIDSKFGRKWLNRLCDTHSMWCHIKNENDVFLTSDKNFMKETKLPLLMSLGANGINHPNEINV